MGDWSQVVTYCCQSAISKLSWESDNTCMGKYNCQRPEDRPEKHPCGKHQIGYYCGFLNYLDLMLFSNPLTLPSGSGRKTPGNSVRHTHTHIQIQGDGFKDQKTDVQRLSKYTPNYKHMWPRPSPPSLLPIRQGKRESAVTSMIQHTLHCIMWHRISLTLSLYLIAIS